MNIIIAIAQDRSLRDSLKALVPDTNLLLFEPSLDAALRRMITVQPDVLLLDDTAGIQPQNVQQLLAQAGGARIIVLLAHESPEASAAYYKAGARACIAKPFDTARLLEAISSAPAESFPVVAPRALTLPDEPLYPVTPQLYQSALRWMARAAECIEDPVRLVQSLVDAVVDTLDAARVAVLLQSGDSVRIAACHGVAQSLATSVRLGFSEGIMRALEGRSTMVLRESLPPESAASKEMRVLGAEIAVPLFIDGRVCGALMVGESVSGLAYAAPDRALMAQLARNVSACLEKAQTLRDVAKQQGRLDAVLSHITAGVVTVQSDKSVSMMNEAAERILRVRCAEALGQSVHRLGSTFADVVLRALRDGEPRLRREILDHGTGTRLGLSVTPLGHEGVVVIFTALTDGSRDEDVHYSPIWEYLSARVAQEIKNPLVAISTFAQLLPEKFGEDEFRTEFAEVVQSEVKRINRVVESLYEFSDRPRLDFTEEDLNESVESVLAEFGDAFTQHAIDVETSMNGSRIAVRVDTKQFSKAVGHVIQNALDAMPNGGKLRISTARKNGICSLRIANSGDSIAAGDAAKIFAPFFSTKETGVGLGLTLARRIVQEHEGRLELDGETDGGGSFVIELPPAGE